MRISHLRSDKKVNENAYSEFLKKLAPLSSINGTQSDELHIEPSKENEKYINEVSYLQAAQLYYMQSNPSVVQFSATYFR